MFDFTYLRRLSSGAELEYTAESYENNGDNYVYIGTIKCNNCNNECGIIFVDKIPIAYGGSVCICNPPKPSEYFNLGIKSLGFELIEKCLLHFYNVYNLPIISVGSGTAAIESLIDIPWITIDPDPLSFNNKRLSEPFLQVDCDYVEDMIQFDPDLVNNCTLFLNWCDPESTYDYDAVIALNPISILSIIELYNNAAGAAGSDKFHKLYKDAQNGKSDYKIIHTVELDKHEYGDKSDIRLIWLQRKDVVNTIFTGLPNNSVSKFCYKEYF